MTATLDRPEASSGSTSTASGWWYAIAGGHLVLWAVIMLGGWLYWDDFLLQGQAARLGLSADLLLNNHDGHVMPLTYICVWAIESIAGLNYVVVALTMLLAQIVYVIATMLVMRALLGRGVPALVASAFFLLCPIMFPGVTWWAAALTVVPFLTCAMFATVALLRYYRTGSRAALLTTFALVAVALGFFEKSLLIPLWLFLVTVLVQPTPRFWASLKQALTAHWRMWVAWLVLLAVYLVAFAQVAAGRTRLPTGPGQVLELLVLAVFKTIAPGLAGGPLRWTPVDFSASFADPGILIMTAGVLVTGCLVWVGTKAPGVARKAWIVAALYLLADLATLAIGRLGPDGDPGIVQAGRYIASSMLPISIAIGATFAQHEELVRRRRLPLSITGGAIAFLTCISVLAYAAIWWNNPAESWVGRARADLAAADPAVPLLDQDVPDFLLLPVTHPYNQASWFLAPLPQQPGFAVSTPRLQLLDNRGSLVAAQVDGARALPAPRGCYRVGPGRPATIELEHGLFAWAHTVQVDYTAERAGTIDVSIGSGEAVRAPVVAGDNSVFVRAEGGDSSITVASVDASLCVRQAVVGRVIPAALPYGGVEDIGGDPTPATPSKQ